MPKEKEKIDKEERPVRTRAGITSPAWYQRQSACGDHGHGGLKGPYGHFYCSSAHGSHACLLSFCGRAEMSFSSLITS